MVEVLGDEEKCATNGCQLKSIKVLDGCDEEVVIFVGVDVHEDRGAAPGSVSDPTLSVAIDRLAYFEGVDLPLFLTRQDVPRRSASPTTEQPGGLDRAMAVPDKRRDSTLVIALHAWLERQGVEAGRLRCHCPLTSRRSCRTCPSR